MTILDYRTGDGVAHITMTRSESLNAMNKELGTALTESFAAAAADPEIRVIVLRGEGKSFCAGADLKDEDTHNARDIVQHLEPGSVDVLTSMRKPVIAGVQRHCVGVGVELAIAADICVAASDAVFFSPQVSLGILPGAGGVARLVRRVGETWASRLILLGERIDAATALRIGLVSEIVEREALDARVEELAATLAAQPTASVQLAKEAILEAPEVPLSSALQADKYRLFVLSDTDEKKASHAAFASGNGRG